MATSKTAGILTKKPSKIIVANLVFEIIGEAGARYFEVTKSLCILLLLSLNPVVNREKKFAQNAKTRVFRGAHGRTEGGAHRP